MTRRLAIAILAVTTGYLSACGQCIDCERHPLQTFSALVTASTINGPLADVEATLVADGIPDLVASTDETGHAFFYMVTEEELHSATISVTVPPGYVTPASFTGPLVAGDTLEAVFQVVATP